MCAQRRVTKGDQAVLSVVKPIVAMQIIDNVELQKVVAEFEGQLKKVLMT